MLDFEHRVQPFLLLFKNVIWRLLPLHELVGQLCRAPLSTAVVSKWNTASSRRDCAGICAIISIITSQSAEWIRFSKSWSFFSFFISQRRAYDLMWIRNEKHLAFSLFSLSLLFLVPRVVCCHFKRHPSVFLLQWLICSAASHQQSAGCCLAG